jgi:CheY-like chemotaxis protein
MSAPARFQRIPVVGKRVLIVDDDSDARDLLRCVLESRGLRVYEAASASEAFEVLDSLEINLIISDIEMPDCDGHDLLREVRTRSRGHTIPAMALSALAGTQDCARSARAGFAVHMSKPFEVPRLWRAVKELLLR